MMMSVMEKDETLKKIFPQARFLPLLELISNDVYSNTKQAAVYYKNW